MLLPIEPMLALYAEYYLTAALMIEMVDAKYLDNDHFQ
jgi:hypothetical protein